MESGRVIPDQGLVPEDHVIVVFGANGDLARRKVLPALFHLTQAGLMPERFRVIGSSRSEMSDDDFKAFARAAINEFCRCEATDGSWKEFSEKLSYISHEFRPGDTEPIEGAVRAAEAELGGQPRRLFYLAVPPPAFAVITRGLGACGLAERAKVIYEKPYGLDLDSFRELDEDVHAALDESQVYRIDHFLGKETVQNILALRFANGMFEPVWNRDHIDHVQIDVPETLGIGTRAGFYEKTGALRDMVVTHVLQVLSFVALEPPASLDAKALLDEKVKVFESIVPLSPDDVVRGQFEGYRDIAGVAPESDTETFVAARLRIDNGRWGGVPFFLRTGKRMAAARSSVILAFRSPPHQMFPDFPKDRFGHDHLALELGPEEGVTATFLAKAPGPTIKLAPARMEFRYRASFGSELIEAYERLTHDALIGDHTLFTTAKGIRRIWETLGAVIDAPPPLHHYAQESWGPDEATELISPRRWHLPAKQP